MVLPENKKRDNLWSFILFFLISFSALKQNGRSGGASRKLNISE
jgi:hypothetical protein